ncbi:NIN-like protein [Tanacetum coccineum]
MGQTEIHTSEEASNKVFGERLDTKNGLDTLTEHDKHSSTHQNEQTEQYNENTAATNTVNILTIEATYRDLIARFHFRISEGLVKLEELVATMFQLDFGSFKLKYVDADGDLILIACDSALTESVGDFRQTDHQTMIRLLVLPVGKSMWGDVSGTRTKLMDCLLIIMRDYWIHGRLIVPRLYTQSNFAKQYQLDTNIRSLQQNYMSIQEFYSTVSVLWDYLSLIEPPELSSFDAYVKRRDSQRLVQFLMALRHGFEGLRGSIMQHNPLPSVDFVVSELLEEEARLKSHDNKNIVSLLTFMFRTQNNIQYNL